MPVYPSALDTFPGTTAQGTALLASGPDHAADHRLIGSVLGTVEQVIGTTNGTSIAMNFAAGDFAVRMNSGGTLQQSISGSAKLLAGTINNAIIGTPAITGGTFNSGVIGTPAITGGTVTSGVLVSPTSPSGSALSGALQAMMSNNTLVNGSVVNTTPLVMVAGTFTTTQTANIYAQISGVWYQSGTAQNHGTLYFNGTAITGATEIVDDFNTSNQAKVFSGAGTFTNFSGTGTISMQYSVGGSGTAIVSGAHINALIFNA